MSLRPVHRIAHDTPGHYYSGQMPFCAAFVIVMIFRRPIILVTGQVLQRPLELTNTLSLWWGGNNRFNIPFPLKRGLKIVQLGISAYIIGFAVRATTIRDGANY